jgi:flagellar motor switch protein FliM
MANEPILNQEEVDALLVGMDEGRVPLADPTGATDVRRYELGREARIVRARMPTLAMLNERYARLYRHSICNILRRSAGVIGGQIRMVQFADYLQSVRTPSSINLLRFAPLRGTVLLVMSADLVFAVVENFFGGRVRPTRYETRDFTATETRIVQMLRDAALVDLREAWSSIMPVTIELASSETNPQFLTVMSPNDVVVVADFTVEIESVSSTMSIAIPYSSLEPHKELLGGNAHENARDEDGRWHRSLREDLEDADLELRAVLGTRDVRLAQLLDFRPGDVVPFEFDGRATVFAEDVPFLRGRYGVSRGQQAVKVEQRCIGGRGT